MFSSIEKIFNPTGFFLLANVYCGRELSVGNFLEHFLRLIHL